MQERKRLEQSLADERRIATITSDLDTLFELAREGEDVNGDIARELKSFSELLEKVETAMLLSGASIRLTPAASASSDSPLRRL